MSSSCRAFTEFRRRRAPSGLLAIVHLPPSGSLPAELIGHEFEHVIEQIEDLDLRSLAQVRNSGVFRVEENLFETDRARRIGQKVDNEARGRQ